MELSKGKGNFSAKGKLSSNERSSATTTTKTVRRKRAKPPSLHKEYVPTAEEQADIDDMLKKAREATAVYEKKRKKQLS